MNALEREIALSADGAPVSIEVLLDEGAWTRPQKIILALLVIIFISEGIDGNLLGATIPSMARDWSVAPAAFSGALFLSSLGAGIGGVIGGQLADRYGRKWPLTLSALLFGLVTAMTPLTGSLAALGVNRFVSGLGLGLCLPPALAMVSELTPRRYRGRAMAFALALTMVGIAMSSALAGLLLERLGWPLLYVLGGLVPAAWAVLLMLVIPETPQHLVRFPARRERLDRVMARLGHPVRGVALAPSHDPRRDAPGSLMALISAPFRRVTFAIGGAFFGLFLMISTVLGWLPTMMATQGFSLKQGNFAITAWSIGGLAGTMGAGWLCERFGAARASRALALGALAGTMLLFLNPARGTGGMTLTFALLALVGALTAGLVTSLYAATADAYPSRLLGTGLGTAGAVGRGAMLLSAYLGAFAMAAAGYRGFFSLALAAILAVALVLRALPTRNALTQT